MRTFLAYLVCKISQKILKLLGRGGSLPGELALKIQPKILEKIQYPKEVILITATNGKTSTTNLIAQTLLKASKKVIYNSKGDNMIFGILTLLITNSNMALEVNADIAVLEIDELTLAKYLPRIPATKVMINNFFRDQLDRSGEMEAVVTKIEDSLLHYKNTLILNQDDPNVLRIKEKATQATVFTYSLNENIESSKISHEASEGKFCPVCHHKIKYEYYQYSHIGKFKCENCGFGNCQPYKTGQLINNQLIVDNNTYQLNNNNLYHVYNCLAVITIADLLNIDFNIVFNTIKSFKIELGRNEIITVKGKPCLLNLVKNPTGCNEILKMISKDHNQKVILFVLNDNEQDSRDVSWIWDVDFEKLNNIKKIICSGKRAYEIALRFKYSAIQTEIIVIENYEDAIKTFVEHDTLYALATYTALPNVRKELLRWN